MSFPPPALREIANEVAALLRERKESVSVAETVCNSSSSSIAKEAASIARQDVRGMFKYMRDSGCFRCPTAPSGIIFFTLVIEMAF